MRYRKIMHSKKRCYAKETKIKKERTVAEFLDEHKAFK